MKNLIIYPIRAEKGHPTMAPAATPKIAKGGESWNHPVIAIRVVYIQKDDGRKAEEKEKNEWIFCLMVMEAIF